MGMPKKYFTDKEKRRAQIEGNRRWRLSHRDYIKEYKKANRYKYRAWTALYHRKYKIKGYGLTPDAYQKLLDNQNGRCAICGILLKKPHIDHNHKTGATRGLLCSRCNPALGHIENLVFLKSAMNYLRRYDDSIPFLSQ